MLSRCKMETSICNTYFMSGKIKEFKKRGPILYLSREKHLSIISLEIFERNYSINDKLGFGYSWLLMLITYT